MVNDQEHATRVYATLLPGNAAGGESPEGIYFVMGPDKQLDAWEQYLKSAAGGAKLQRLYGREFWLP